MILSINQPAYIPWAGYFDRVDASDCHVILDHVQFEKNSFTNRNKVKSHSGPIWLTMPVKTKGRFGDLDLLDLEIDNSQKWAKKHIGTLKQCYAKSPFFKVYFPEIEDLLQKSNVSFFETVEKLNGLFFSWLSIETPMVKSSLLNLKTKKSEMILDICERMHADTYYSGIFGRDYLNMEGFKEAGIKVMFHDYEYPEHSQLHGDFEPNLSIIDLLFNHGEESMEIIRKGRIVKND